MKKSIIPLVESAECGPDRNFPVFFSVEKPGFLSVSSRSSCGKRGFVPLL
jgi:hypothetical protein